MSQQISNFALAVKRSTSLNDLDVVASQQKAATDSDAGRPEIAGVQITERRKQNIMA